MRFCENVGKALLTEVGIAVPKGVVVSTASAAADATTKLGPTAIKALVPTGRRGKAGAVRLVSDPAEAAIAVEAILGMRIDGYQVSELLVEQQVPVSQELYAAVVNHASSGGPLMLFSACGGMDVEQALEASPEAVVKCVASVGHGLEPDTVRKAIGDLLPEDCVDAVAQSLLRLYDLYLNTDAEIIEINPLAITTLGAVVALDCKLAVDDAALPRQQSLARLAATEPSTSLEAAAAAAGLKFIELEGDIGILANGAGLTMTTMDAVEVFGGKPANFLEIGGEAYRSADVATALLLRKPGLKSIVVNFCGAFARCDVMAAGVIETWKELEPEIPVFFSVLGTGDTRARSMIRRELGIKPFQDMDDAVRSAVEAAASRS
ncbi:MAG: acetate--CoA ligase family protein [Rhodobacteraceae bacterium]|nr:acetate--CoA ligase family protein [Paracoccaceae bacterium]